MLLLFYSNNSYSTDYQSAALCVPSETAKQQIHECTNALCNVKPTCKTYCNLYINTFCPDVFGNDAYSLTGNGVARRNADNIGQCTWFAWGRAHEVNGINTPDFSGDAVNWYTDKVKNTIRSNSIAVWYGDANINPHGHVAYVEKVEGDSVTYNEANVLSYQNNSIDRGGYDGQPKTSTISAFERRGGGIGNIKGYIYLDNSAQNPIFHPGMPSINPAGFDWSSSPNNININSRNSEKIYYYLTYTTDGNDPAEPIDPTIDDSEIKDSTLQLYAQNGQFKKFKVKFRGYNQSAGLGDVSPIYSYSIDLRPKITLPGQVVVNANNQTWYTPSNFITVKTDNLGDAIYYNVTSTSDGITTPSDPAVPFMFTSSGMIPGWTGNFEVHADAGQYKKLKVRFRAYNNQGYGPVSEAYSYTVDLRPKVHPLPSAISANPPSAVWQSSPQYISLSSNNADKIFYTLRVSTDGVLPADPPEPTESSNDGVINGSNGIFNVWAEVGQNKKIKVRFRGYNSAGYGVTSNSFSYT
jgi:surface antigen